ncbi:hypothetical protein LX36DRAFT_304006 [Colletotrichum falcatum]|nr:hypothetical protein LX36DRAFT_304006 [Colletotrichum falcatum]
MTPLTSTRALIPSPLFCLFLSPVSAFPTSPLLDSVPERARFSREPATFYRLRCKCQTVPTPGQSLYRISLISTKHSFPDLILASEATPPPCTPVP